MTKQIVLYDYNLKRIVKLNYSKEEFLKDPAAHYPDWENEVLLISETELHDIRYYKIENDEIVKKEDVELKLEDLMSLSDGEYIDTNNEGVKEVIVVPQNPELFKNGWDKEKHEWYELGTEEEIYNYRSNTILGYEKEIKATGYTWRVTMEDTTHIQRIDADKITALDGVIDGLNTMDKITGTSGVDSWLFDDFGQDGVMYNAKTFEVLKYAGAQFERRILEARIAMLYSNIMHITKEQFLGMLANYTNVCVEINKGVQEFSSVNEDGTLTIECIGNIMGASSKSRSTFGATPKSFIIK